MKLGLLVGILQCIGLLIPLAGIVAILQREQTKTSTYLMLANIGCLIMNSGYFLMIRAASDEEALVAYKMEYLGNSIFYLFFILFLCSYFKKSPPKWTFYVWGVFEAWTVVLVWSELHLDMINQELGFRLENRFGFMYAQIKNGLIHEIRYAALSLVLVFGIGFSLYRMFNLKSKEERANLGRLIGAEAVVAVSLILMQLFQFRYDLVPIAASCAICSIVLGVISGEFRIEDIGREWVFEDMRDAFLVVDDMYGYLDANASAKNFFPGLELCLKNERVPEYVYQMFTAPDEEVILEGRHYMKKVLPIEQKGAVRGYSMLLSDIQEQHLLMEELKIQKEKAEDANRAKSAFMSTMSHEIRTPMNAIVGMTDILLRSELKDREKEYLANIRSSGEALLSIINDILDFSKIEAGKLEIIEEEYAPMSMLNDLSMIFLNRIAEKPVELLFDIDKNLPARLYGDALRIRQVIINIVNNAIKFTDSGYVILTIEVHTMDAENVTLQIRVKDTGQGMKEEDLDKLFGSFAQVDKKKNKYKEGTGLGLSISKQLAELMGGTISVQSEYGKGSEFTITLPQRIVNAEPAATIKENKNIVVAGMMRSEGAQEVLYDLVEKYHLTYSECNFECVENHKIDFFFTDQLNLVSDEMLERMKDKGTTLCAVLNPMADASWDKEALVINKPLYTLNFCQVINGEKASAGTTTQQVICFSAPEAKVLIADDNEMNLKVAKGLLEPLKMQIDTAENGKIALEMIQKKRYDLVFMDHMMPVMDGIEAVMALRALDDEYCRTVPVIALTANAIAGAKEEFLRAGMNDFVAKPIQLKEICSKIKKWLPEELLQDAEGCGPVAEGTEEFPVIEGLDTAEGIANCGTKELFFSLLGDFYKLIDLKSVKIEKCLADGMLRDYTIEVHALKNTARMIGAMELSEKFYYLEQMGNKENTEVLEKETPDVLQLYRSYKNVLKEYALASGGQKETDSQNLISLLNHIKTAIDEFDLDGADEALKELEEYRLPEHLQTKMELLRAYVADVAMEEIMTLTDEMIAGLSE